MPTSTVDLTTSGQSGTINGAIFTNDATHAAGSGVFNTFLEIQHNGTEQGYNTSGTHQFDEKAHTHALLLADVPIVFGDGSNGTEEGVAYREFKLDINEAGNSGLLSLDQLQIWQEESGNLGNFNTNGTGFAGAHTNHLVYNMDAGGDHWVALNAGLSSGSGGGDMRVLIRNDLFTNDAADRYVYLYSKFGQQGGSYATSGGFEEWGVGNPAGGPTNGAVLDLQKTATVPGGTADTAGETISYSIKVSNFGSVNLTNITVTDPSVSDMTRGADIVGNNDSVLNPGETWSYTAHRTVTQADIDTNGNGAGEIDNTVTADSDQTAPTTATATVAVEPKAHVSITKTPAIPDTDTANDPTLHDGKIDSPADDISYTYKVVNDGNVTLHNPEVGDSILGTLTSHTESGGSGLNGDGILDVGETWTYTASYDVTQADIDNKGSIDGDADNFIHNIASVVTEDGAINATSADVGIDYRPHLTLSKSALIPDIATRGDPTLVDGKIDSPADDITYTYTIVNNGNVTLHNVALTDSVAGTVTSPIETGGTGTNGDGILDVGETWTYTAGYDVTQADIDNRGNVDGTADKNIHNAASVTTTEGATGSASADVGIDYRVDMPFDKAGTFRDDNGDGFAQVGEHIDYTFTVTNAGNVTLHNVGVSDPDGNVTITGSPIASLAPGAVDSTTYAGTYAINATDIAAGQYENTAVAAGDEASTPDTVVVTLPPPPPAAPTLVLDKSSSSLIDGDESGGPSVADPIQYFFTLTNGGTAALHDVQLDDTLFGMIAFTPDSPDANGQLDPGEIWLMGRTYLITADDVAAGEVNNDATATGLDPTAQLVTSNTAHWHLDF
jgi:uncharacterized repeat protein (TIGR01451 family)